MNNSLKLIAIIVDRNISEFIFQGESIYSGPKGFLVHFLYKIFDMCSHLGTCLSSQLRTPLIKRLVSRGSRADFFFCSFYCLEENVMYEVKDPSLQASTNNLQYENNSQLKLPVISFHLFLDFCLKNLPATVLHGKNLYMFLDSSCQWKDFIWPMFLEINNLKPWSCTDTQKGGKRKKNQLCN